MIGGGKAKATMDGRLADDYLLACLFVARVAKAETVNTMRRDVKAIFREAYDEAKVALDVYLEQQKGK